MSESFYSYELKYSKLGIPVAGADEVGRGPLAGPVVAGAIIMRNDFFVPGIDDSKKLTEKKREALYDTIMENALSFGIGVVGPEVIDEIGILNATRRAFEEAISKLKKPYVLYTDYITGLSKGIEYTPLVKGDATVYTIAAASIMAKVYRDRLMAEYDEIYHGYDFKKHKGYGTKAHYEAIRELGPSPIHRRSFLKVIH
ncbi:MAG: ribonuclease HII [Clostridia bacterium]|nr:ribonuclease HII [Clostridia bacterium]MBQ5956375.1 ribonuclease HII [Clostridia bacterium]